MKGKYRQNREQVNNSNKEEKVYSLKKIVDDLQIDNKTCLHSMTTSLVAASTSNGFQRVIHPSLLKRNQILAILHYNLNMTFYVYDISKRIIMI